MEMAERESKQVYWLTSMYHSPPMRMLVFIMTKKECLKRKKKKLSKQVFWLCVFFFFCLFPF